MSTEPEREFVGNGRYALDQILGQGGVGVVVLAYDIEKSRWDAMKRLPSTDPEVLREAGGVVGLEHPNIATVHEVFAEGSEVLVAMEFVQGQALGDLAEPMAEETFRDFAAQCLEGLRAAHEKNLIHRGIKPGNIMLAALPEGGFQVKLLDFGQSRLREASLQTPSPGGAAGEFLAMMAPEQLRREEVDARADIFALGCVFYQALTRQIPYVGENPEQLLAAQANRSSQPLASLRPELPAPLAAWVERMFAPDRNDRPASAAEALQALQSTHAAPVQAAPVIPAPPMLKATPAVDLSAATMRVVLPLKKANAPVASVAPVAAAAPVSVVAAASVPRPVSVVAAPRSVSVASPIKSPTPSPRRAPDPEPAPAPRFPLGIVAAAAAVVLLAGGGWGVWNFFLKSPPVPVAPVAPDASAVPKDKPLPPAKKELVPVSQQVVVKQDVLAMFDKNKDGEITHEEFRGIWSGQFDYLDANRDGKLDRNEWRNPAFTGMDLDKSGFLEKQEWMRYRDWCFSTFMDANKDGKAVPGEWK
jgi:hypothetical protein